jgi:hypothetical protein
MVIILALSELILPMLGSASSCGCFAPPVSCAGFRSSNSSPSLEELVFSSMSLLPIENFEQKFHARIQRLERIGSQTFSPTSSTITPLSVAVNHFAQFHERTNVKNADLRDMALNPKI